MKLDGYKKWSLCLAGIAGIITSVILATYDQHIDGLHKVEIHLASIGGIVAIVGGYCGFQGWIDKIKAVGGTKPPDAGIPPQNNQ